MTDVFSRAVDRFGIRTMVVVAVVAVVALVTAGYVVYNSITEGEYEITAQFAGTPGLYADNSVDILGVPTGHIVSIKAKPKYVEVKLALPDHVKIPADAKAVVVALNPVSDRFVELTPAYTGGPRMKSGTTISLKDTVVPLELDDIYNSVDTFANALGPKGANKNGALSDVLHAFAKLANGQGGDVHQAIAKIAAALPALTAHPDDLSKLINGLDKLTGTLAQRNDAINSVYDDLDTVTSELAGERQTIASAIANLQRGLQSVGQFITQNQANIGSSVRDLTTTVSAIMSEQKALIQTFDVAPLGFQNFDRSITLHGPCPTPNGKPATCPGVYARAILGDGLPGLIAQYCGSPLNSVIAILAYNSPINGVSVGRRGDALDTVCAAAAGLDQKRPAPPGAPPIANLQLSSYVGS